MADPLSFPAAAKVNLYLHVTGKRDDGYHTLDSLVAFAGINDTVSVRPADDLTLAIDGPFADRINNGDDNLVIRAAHALRDAAAISAGADIRLTKRLPVSSGIGGGSADAAATLRALSELWKTALPEAEMNALALGLGADVPVCLAGRAAFMGGIGEDLSPAPTLPACAIVLVNPGVAVSTPDVFSARSGDFSAPAPFDHAPGDAAELASILTSRGNDLTAAALSLAPEIGDVLAALEAADDILLARMSGSGATCFGLFSDPAQAATAALSIGQKHSDWWVKAASLEADAGHLRRPS